MGQQPPAKSPRNRHGEGDAELKFDDKAGLIAHIQLTTGTADDTIVWRWHHNIKKVDRVYSGKQSQVLQDHYPKSFELSPVGRALEPRPVVFGWSCTECPCIQYFDKGDAIACAVCGTRKDPHRDYSIGVVGTCNQKYLLGRHLFGSINEDSKLEFLISILPEGDTQTLFQYMEGAKIANNNAIPLKAWLEIIKMIG